MKISKFNSYFPYLGKSIGYNSFSNQFVALENELLDLLDAADREKKVDELGMIHPDFYAFLIEKGFIVEAEVDEFEKVKKLSQQIDNDETSFHLHINPTMNCNFKCWYCYETHIKGSKMSEATINNTISFVRNLLHDNKKLKKFHLAWFGGEPLLYFDKVVKPLLTAIKALCEAANVIFSSAITTNGLLVNQDLISFCKENGLRFFQITLDGNEEQHNKVRFISNEKGSYKQIVENIKLLANNDIDLNVRINCSPETFTDINSIAADFDGLDAQKKKRIQFDFHKVWQVNADVDQLLTDTRGFFRANGYSVSSGSQDSVAHSCYGDKRNHATINYNGEVFKCTARDFTSSNKEGKLSVEGISWNPKYEKRLNSKFKNKPCMECKILPICGGGCSQQALENEGKDYCVHNFDEQKKLDIIRQKFQQTILAEY